MNGFIHDELLIKLFRSLTPAEKRYFSSRFLGRKNDYQVLYEKLCGTKEETLLAEGIPAQIEGISNLSRARKQLKDQILQSLRLQYEDTSIDNEINARIHEAFLLKKKGLYNQCERLLERTKKEAIRYERYYQVLIIIDRQIRLSLNNFNRDLTARAQELHQNKKEVLKKIKVLESLEEIRHKAFLLFRRGEDVMGEVEQLMKKLKKKNKFSTFFSENARLDALAILSKLKLDNEAARKYYEEILALWKSKKYSHFIKAYPYQYKLHIYNYLNALHKLEKYEEFEEIFAIAESIPPMFLEEEVEDFQNIYFLRLLMLMNTKQLKAAKDLVPKIESLLSRFSDEMEALIEARRLAIYFNIAVLFFILEEFDNAESWFLRVFNFSLSREHRRDLQYLSRIFCVIILYEKERIDDMNQRISSIQRRHDNFSELGNIVFKHLNTLQSSNDNQEKQKNWKTACKEIKKLRVKKPGAGGLQEIEIWILSRRDGKTMEEVFLEG